MPLAYYMDDDAEVKPVATGLRQAGIDVVRTAEIGTRGKPDHEHLAEATRQARVLVTANRRDFLALHADWMATNRHHAGIVILVQQSYSIGELIRRLRALSDASEPGDLIDRIEFLNRWGSAQ